MVTPAPAVVAPSAPVAAFATSIDLPRQPPAIVAASPLASAPVLDEREHAIEVAVMLGDSVVAHKHCALPVQERKLAPRWWFAIAGVAAVIGVIAFALTVRVAAANDTAFKSWVAKGRPAYAFRPQLVGAEYDAAGFAGLALALAAATMGLVRLRQARLHPLFRIGTAPDVELPLADAPAPSFPLVSARGDRLVVRSIAAFGGELVVDNVVTPIGELAAQGRARALGDGSCELMMPLRGRARLRCGSATVLLSVVPRPAQQLPLTVGQFDKRVLAYVAGALAAHLALVALLRVMPEDATVATIDIDTIEDIGLRTSDVANDTKPEEPEKGQSGDTAAGATASSDAMKLPSGAAGDPKEAASNQRLSIKRSDSEQQLARQVEIDRATRSGILGSTAMRERNWGAIMGADGNTSGVDDATFYGNLFGDQPGGSSGGFGGGPNGVGPGGGGDGIVGYGGRYNTIGTFPGGNGPFGGGACRGPGPCRGLHGRDNVVPETIRFTDPQCGPNGCGLDKSIIRRYVKRATEKIRYCYEKELLANPSLEGTVMSSFVISPTGTVINSKANGVDDKVSSCVAGVVGSIAFPRPGDAVQVNYPFNFRHP